MTSTCECAPCWTAEGVGTFPTCGEDGSPHAAAAAPTPAPQARPGLAESQDEWEQHPRRQPTPAPVRPSSSSAQGGSSGGAGPSPPRAPRSVAFLARTPALLEGGMPPASLIPACPVHAGPEQPGDALANGSLRALLQRGRADPVLVRSPGAAPAPRCPLWGLGRPSASKQAADPCRGSRMLPPAGQAREQPGNGCSQKAETPSLLSRCPLGGRAARCGQGAWPPPDSAKAHGARGRRFKGH